MIKNHVVPLEYPVSFKQHAVKIAEEFDSNPKAVRLLRKEVLRGDWPGIESVPDRNTLARWRREGVQAAAYSNDPMMAADMEALQIIHQIQRRLASQIKHLRVHTVLDAMKVLQMCRKLRLEIKSTYPNENPEVLAEHQERVKANLRRIQRTERKLQAEIHDISQRALEG